MKNLILALFVLAISAPAHAKIQNVVNCADEYTSVQIETSGQFGSDEYNVLITDLRNGEKFGYSATLQNGSFISAGNPTINTSPNSIAFVKAGWGLVVIEGENCDINLP